MQIQAIQTNQQQKNSTTFGHSFRVSICLKNERNLGDYFVSPASNKKLYRELNSKIVGWLNEDYYTNLRKLLGKERKSKKTEPLTNLHKKMVEDLKILDSDYSKFNHVRSVYNGGRLGYIATGVDVAIIENLKGIKQIGIAQSDSKWFSGSPVSDYVKTLSKVIQSNVRGYVQNPNILLRSDNNKEIMLKAVFKETKNPQGKSVYELDKYEFHENKTTGALPPIQPEILRYKYNNSTQEEINRTIKYHVDKIMGYKTHFKDFDKILTQKREP